MPGSKAPAATFIERQTSNRSRIWDNIATMPIEWDWEI
jgi:hypothetical protein